MKSDGERPKRRIKSVKKADKKISAKAKQRGELVVDSYRKAFQGFTKEELMILDGIIPARVARQ